MIVFKSLIFLCCTIFVSSTEIISQVSNLTNDCYITQYSQVANALSKCTSIVIDSLVVPSGKTLDLKLKDGAILAFKGTTTFEVGYNDVYLMTISGNNINVFGESGSLIHGQGEKYWDGQGGSGGVTKPKLFLIQDVNHGVFKNINLKNCPMFCTTILKSNYVTIDGFKADCSEGDSGSAHVGRNTDGIGIAWCTNLYINNVFIHNQDQCLYVNQGSNMVFTNIHCVNSNGICATAGYSQTSYEENTTKNITFHNCVMEGGLTGVQILAKWNAGLGEISDITFQNVKLVGVRQQGIFVEMDSGNTGHINNNIEVKNLKMSQIYGTVEGNGARAIYIKCGAKCHDWIFSNINVSGGGTPNSCNYVPAGFSC
ncbi:polygalacturonase-like [Diorhabda sublineata]|uniref:polygalacturonase-like n=1 Tax=Diorhabda sublineata TaxID=1163346 RepID=UPI0024E121E1|nr:polygalacturonase-like [Diorhabda sublineata]